MNERMTCGVRAPEVWKSKYPSTAVMKNAMLRTIRAELRRCRALPVRDAVARVNPIVRGWVNYFCVGNSAKAFSKVKFHVENQVRRFAARQRQRKGLGWERWSRVVVYETWGLFNDYRIVYALTRKSALAQTEA